MWLIVFDGETVEVIKVSVMVSTFDTVNCRGSRHLSSITNEFIVTADWLLEWMFKGFYLFSKQLLHFQYTLMYVYIVMTHDMLEKYEQEGDEQLQWFLS